MKNGYLIVGGLAVFGIVFAILAGCTSLENLVYGGSVDNETSILYPDGTIVWAVELNKAADEEARQAATYQKVEQVAIWKFLGWDFEFDKTTLATEIQKGNLRLGDRVNNLGFKSGGRFRGAHGAETVYGDGESSIILIDPSRPSSYYAVQAKRIENRTVDALDKAKYQEYFVLSRNAKIAYIHEKLSGYFVDVTDDEKFYFNDGGSISGKTVKARFEKRLKELAPGSMLINGGFYDDSVITASIVDGILVCQKAK